MSKNCTFFIGTSGWSYPHWHGTFYPAELAKNKWFEYYCEQFKTVELNATFYHAFADNTYEKWYNQAPAGFKYVIKAHRLITHRKYLRDVEAEIKRCWDSAALLKEKLGLILLQLPPQMPYDLDRLAQALNAFPDPHKVAVEFRNKKWLTEDTKQLLTKLKVTFCTSDAPEIGLTNWLTSDIGYIRLHGHDLSYSGNYSEQELKNIATLAKNMAQQGAKTVYVFFNNDAEGYAPMNAQDIKSFLD